MKKGARIGILGGTLDPIHMGHIEAALAAREALRLDRIFVIPAHLPPHRARPASSPFHRFAMAALAVTGLDGFEVSEMELVAPGPSYTADTLRRVAETYGCEAWQIFFITGADAFAEIETWSRYPAVLDLANFVVVARPGMSLQQLRARLPQLKDRMRLPLASSPQEPLIFLVDAPTPDVSSTEIRRRIATGSAISGLVPQGVEQHIQQHALYLQHSVTSSTADHLHGQD